jgi:hypothetical protein
MAQYSVGQVAWVFSNCLPLLTACLPHMRADQACTMHHLPRLQLYPHGAQTYPAANDVDLFVKQGSAPPDAWAQSVADGWAL